MDGHFVPNITIGPIVVAAIAPMVHERGGALDVHLMIENPERYIERFAEAGADGLTVHQEACVHLHRVLAQIREAGAAAGVALNPATPLRRSGGAPALRPGARDVGQPGLRRAVVHPHVGGQADGAPGRSCRPPWPCEIDGGVSLANVAELVEAGANWLVAGSSVYGDGRAADNFRALSVGGGRSRASVRAPAPAARARSVGTRLRRVLPCELRRIPAILQSN